MVTQPPSLPNRTCGFPAYGSPPELSFRTGEARERKQATSELGTLPPPIGWKNSLRGQQNFRYSLLWEDTALSLVADPLTWAFCVSSFANGERERELAYSDLCRRLVHRSMPFPFKLQSLRCSRLSTGVIATMNRSDSSPPPALVFASERGSDDSIRLSSEETRSPSVMRISVPIILTSTTSRVHPVLDFAISGKLVHPFRRITFTFVSG